MQQVMALSDAWLKVGRELLPRAVAAGTVVESDDVADIAYDSSALLFPMGDNELIRRYKWTRKRKQARARLSKSAKLMIAEEIDAAAQDRARHDPAVQAARHTKEAEEHEAFKTRLSQISAAIDRVAAGGGTRDDEWAVGFFLGWDALEKLKAKATGQPAPAA